MIRKNIEQNQLVVAHDFDFRFTGVNIVNVNWIRKIPDLKKNYQVKIRYGSKEYSCIIKKTGESNYSLKFSDFVRDPAPGQYAVLYDEAELIGGGEISEVY